MTRLNDLLDTIRENCSTITWSKGVQLARAKSVVWQEPTEEEIIFQVSDRQSKVSFETKLWPVDDDWNCNCGGKNDPCHHVAAAAIRFHQAEESGEALSHQKKVTQLVYLFRDDDGESLFFDRALQQGEDQKSRKVLMRLNQSAEFTPNSDDYAIDSLLGAHKRGFLPRRTMVKLLKRLVNLSGPKRIFFNENPITIGIEEKGITVSISDHGTGVNVKAKFTQGVKKIYKNGAVLFGSCLYPSHDLGMTEKEVTWLKSGKFFGHMEMISLVTEWLPSLTERFPVENNSRNLPTLTHEQPLIQLTLSKVDGGLLATPQIIYGSPPVAILEGNFLRPLRKKNIPMRDKDKEHHLQNDLERETGLELGKCVHFNDDRAVDFVKSLQAWKGVRAGDGWKSFTIDDNPLIPRINFNNGQFHLDFFTDHSEMPKQAETSKVMEIWERGDSVVPLLGGGFAKLPSDWFHRFGKTIQLLLAAKTDDGDIPSASTVTLVKFLEQMKHPIPDFLKDFKQFARQALSPPQSERPTGLMANLRPYQDFGVDWLNFLKSKKIGAILADDMGLGKTLQTISILESKSLVIAPTSLLQNWKKELSRFRPNLNVSIFHGHQRKMDNQADVIITSYAIIRLDLDDLKKHRWSCIVLDEAQAIKNPDSQIAQACFQLPARFRMVLSGTPIENSLEDLWSLFHFVNPGHLGTLKDFKNKIIKPAMAEDESALMALRSQIRPFILRRLKSQVAPALPPRTESVLYVQLSPEERNIYDSIAALTAKEAVEKLKKGGTVIEALEALLRLRQACCHPSLLPGHQAVTSAKLDILLEKVEYLRANGHKILVFSQWTSFLNIIEKSLMQTDASYLRLDGTTKNRGEIVEKFQSDHGPEILIMSLKAGGVGLNLSQADHVFIMDPWWNPSAEDQAADRAHRIGQTKPVVVHPVIAMETVESKILELQKIKRNLAKAAIGEKMEQSLTLTRDNLLNLLENI